MSVGLTAGAALAAGDIDLQWGDCPPHYGGAGVTNKGFACTSNIGADILVGSFSAPVDMPQMVADEGVIDLHVGNATLDPLVAGVADYTLTTGANQLCTWRGGPFFDCFTPDPGAVKPLYR